jgi:hypothetical protein
MGQRDIGAARRTCRPRSIKRCAVAACLTAASLAGSASPAIASVTIGQLAPNSTLVTCNSSASDWAEPTVTSGNTYVVPPVSPASALVITSWSHNAGSNAGQTLTMKDFRKLGATYTAVGHDGPRPLAARTLNTFPARIPVKPGDVLGVNSASPAYTACIFGAPGDSVLARAGNLADGESGAFGLLSGYRVNVSAVVAPSNSFSLGDATRNKRKGTATLTVDVPNPGELGLSGKGVKAVGAARAAQTVAAAGEAKLVIRARGKKKTTLLDTGKVKLNVGVTYTPTGGDPSTQSETLKLKKR